MDFVNRKAEIRELEDIYALSRRKLFPIVLYGLRRVGKTRLIKEFIKNKKAVYFFVNQQKNSYGLLKEFSEELRSALSLPSYIKFENWDQFIKYLIEEADLEVIVFDEFQNFLSIEKSIFGSLQNLIDQNEEKKPKLLLFSGSSLGLIKEVFQDLKAPLYGRVKKQVKIEMLGFPATCQMLEKLGIDDFEEKILLYSLFSGFPKYYVAIEDYNLNKNPFFKILDRFFLSENAVFEKEVIDLLRLEFGGRKNTYYSILEAIAGGRTKLNEIATSCGTTSTGISAFIDEIVNIYGFVEKRTPITKQDAKDSIYLINNSLFRFWFRFINKNLSYYEIGDYEKIEAIVKKDLNVFIGREFERLCRDFLIWGNKENKFPFKASKIDRWWHKDQEIDYIILNEELSKIAFVEIKWQNKVNAKQITEELKVKKDFVQWRNGQREEYYIIISKSFISKPKIDRCLFFDLKDLQEWSKSSG